LLQHLKHTEQVACIESVSVGLGSKERQKNWIFGVLSTQKWCESQKREEEEGKEGNTCRQTPGV